MRDTIVAARYARALFIVTEKRKETAAALLDLEGAAVALAPGTKVGDFFFSPEIRLQDKRATIRKVFEGRALPIVVVFVDLLLRKHRLRELTMVATQYRELVEKSQGIHRAYVVSATPLTTGETDRLLDQLRRITGGTVQLDAEVDPAVLGGVKVRIGDHVIDRTAKTLLDSIHEQLNEALV